MYRQGVCGGRQTLFLATHEPDLHTWDQQNKWQRQRKRSLKRVYNALKREKVKTTLLTIVKETHYKRNNRLCAWPCTPENTCASTEACLTCTVLYSVVYIY